ncbi:hypothetical protein TrVE_jg10652 [Triparma verrucosa]|uniref:Uncharacterized protein n=2 Tax=Triparma TaxID=722752 RepID=A0A9W7E6Z0_9STRA|nr:hypothetical protein TrST_g14057 [Triparma strigata]GMI07265.1 hypothetical protein TrVE_jg10652 [Triparma verrucosa]
MTPPLPFDPPEFAEADQLATFPEFMFFGGSRLSPSCEGTLLDDAVVGVGGTHYATSGCSVHVIVAVVLGI